MRIYLPIFLISLIIFLQYTPLGRCYKVGVKVARGNLFFRNDNEISSKPFIKYSQFILHSSLPVNTPAYSTNFTLYEYDAWNKMNQYNFNPSDPHSKGQLTKLPSQKKSAISTKGNLLLQFFYSCFLPSGELSDDYYRYTIWRAIQRLVAATNLVFCTQALFIALGIKKSSAIGLSAATVWVLKDGLGKFSRIFWATFFGKKFDLDAKKWRFRSAIIFSIGNSLEILTYFYPKMFLFSAAIANALKQMAMLTYSSTRNTIYKSFARNLDNIGDITAKGEAQVAVIDILGMLTGVGISKALNASKFSVILTFLTLTLLDLISGLCEIRSVVFNSLNFERAHLTLPIVYELLSRLKLDTEEAACDNAGTESIAELRKKITPSNIAKQESLLFSSLPIDRYFACWSKLRFPQSKTKEERERTLLRAIEEAKKWNNNKFLLFFHHSSNPQEIFLEKIKRIFRITSRYHLVRWKGGDRLVKPQILLHKQATNDDIFQALIILHHLFYRDVIEDQPEGAVDKNVVGYEEILQEVLLQKAQRFNQENILVIKKVLVENGWDMDRLMFGSSIGCRVEW